MLDLDFTYVLPMAIFGAVALMTWVFVDLFFGRRNKVDERLERLQGKSPEEPTQSVMSKQGLTKILEMASPTLARPLQPKNEAEAGKLKQRLQFAGFRRDEAAMVFLGLKFIALAVGIVFGGGVALVTAGFSMGGAMRAFFIAGMFFFLPDIILGMLGKKRKEKIFLGLPDALDLLVVCVEAGLGLDQAMRKVADEMAKSAPVLAHEFGMCNMHLQMGRTREQVFKDLGARNGVDDLKTLASVIIQTDKFGSSIAKALRVQSDAMRTQRRQIAEEKAAKTAVKLIFPLVIFIFPGIFVVLVGPAAITVVNEMLPAFQGR